MPVTYNDLESAQYGSGIGVASVTASTVSSPVLMSEIADAIIAVNPAKATHDPSIKLITITGVELRYDAGGYAYYDDDYTIILLGETVENFKVESALLANDGGSRDLGYRCRVVIKTTVTRHEGNSGCYIQRGGSIRYLRDGLGRNPMIVHEQVNRHDFGTILSSGCNNIEIQGVDIKKNGSVINKFFAGGIRGIAQFDNISTDVAFQVSNLTTTGTVLGSLEFTGENYSGDTVLNNPVFSFNSDKNFGGVIRGASIDLIDITFAGFGEWSLGVNWIPTHNSGDTTVTVSNRITIEAFDSATVAPLEGLNLHWFPKNVGVVNFPTLAEIDTQSDVNGESAVKLFDTQMHPSFGGLTNQNYDRYKYDLKARLYGFNYPSEFILTDKNFASSANGVIVPKRILAGFSVDAGAHLDKATATALTDAVNLDQAYASTRIIQEIDWNSTETSFASATVWSPLANITFDSTVAVRAYDKPSNTWTIKATGSISTDNITLLDMSDYDLTVLNDSTIDFNVISDNVNATSTTKDITATGTVVLGSVSDGITVKDATTVDITTLPTSLTLDNTIGLINGGTADVSDWIFLNGASLRLTADSTVITGGNTGLVIDLNGFALTRDDAILVDISAVNIIDGSRAQYYNITKDAELSNGLVSGGAGYIEQFDVNSPAVDVGDTVRLRATYQNGLTAKLPVESFGVLSASGLSFIDIQEDDPIYIQNGIDGELVTKFSADFVNNEVDITTSVDFTGVELYARYVYFETLPDGIRQFFQAFVAVDIGNYMNDVTVLDFLLNNNTADNLKQIDDVRIFKSNDAYPVKNPTTGGGGLDVNWRNNVYVAQSGTSGLTPSESAKLLAIPTASEIDTELTLNHGVGSWQTGTGADLTDVLANQEIINDGVKLASLIIPHDTDVV